MKNPISPWQEEYILAHHTTMTAEQIAVKIIRSVALVKSFCEEKGIECLAKTGRLKRDTFHLPGRIHRLATRKTHQAPQMEKKTERPPAIYTNSPSPFGIASSMSHQ